MDSEEGPLVAQPLDEGNVAVVTGGGSGIGLALAEAFAKKGLSVVLADIEADALAAAAQTVRGHGADVLAVPTDVSREADVAALATATIDRFGAVHVVCNNAGVGGAGDPWTGPLGGWEWTIGVNLWGVIHGVRAFLPHLAMAGAGHIVNTASMAGLMPGFSAPYDATKHAVVALSEALFSSLNMVGVPVGVSCVCPGWVRTSIMDSDRNWPAELGPRPVRDAASEAMMAHAKRAVAEGTPPAVVADLVVNAIEEQRFWVFPHPDFLELAVERWHRIAEQGNPQPRENLPGLPPRSELLAELEALLKGHSPDEPG